MTAPTSSPTSSPPGTPAGTPGGTRAVDGPPVLAAGAPVTLEISGMTCASCAMRIEKKLNRMPGV